ncbi:MAG: hypothetical protein LDL44_00660 [Caenispirillum sp.]|nr:hypothetical protein [Caenispirillum sp.]
MPEITDITPATPATGAQPLPAIKFGSLKTDAKTLADGAWEEVDSLPGVAFLVRPFHYKPYEVARDALLRKLARAAKKTGGVIDPERRDCGIGALMGEHLLLGWRGFVDDDGKTAYEWTKERGVAHLSDPAFRELRAAVMEACAQASETDVEYAGEAGEPSGKR